VNIQGSILFLDRLKMTMETPRRLEPACLEELPEAITDVVAGLAAASAALGQKLNPVAASSLARLVRIMTSSLE